jgi:predicted  nucleic acid-binding Zn-ribbon protein
MIADINKYKKLDKELTNLRQKHAELEKTMNCKISDITTERDQLQTEYNQLKNQLENPTNHLEQELNDLKIENDQLRQSNWKNMEELNKLLNEQKQNQAIKSS